MSIAFNCADCGQSLEIDDTAAGMSIDCPKCTKPVYVPTRPTTVSVPAPTRVTPIAAKESKPVVMITDSARGLPAAIEGGLHCLVIGCGLLILAMILFRMAIPLGMICFWSAVPFQIGALLCAIFGICHGSIKHGLLLLGGVSIMMLLMTFGLVLGLLGSLGNSQKQIEQMMQQFMH